MNIAVIASCLDDKSQVNVNGFIENLISTLATQSGKHKLFFFSNIKPVINLPVNSKLEVITLKSPGKTALQKKLWWEISLPRTLKKYKADLLISFDGRCSHSLKLPQLLIGFDWMHFHAASVKKAAIIFVNSAWGKEMLTKKINIKKEKTEIFSIAIKKTNKPATEREKVKENFTEGREYFLCPCKQTSKDSFVHILKSFSLFKKRQQSSMKLLMFSSPDKKSAEIFSTYKYRNDVVIKEDPDANIELSLLESSYAVILPYPDSETAFMALKSMQAGIPILSAKNSPITDYAGDAALYFEENMEKEMAEKMIRIYTDEKLRNQLIEEGKTKALDFSIQKSAGQILEIIQKTIK